MISKHGYLQFRIPNFLRFSIKRITINCYEHQWMHSISSKMALISKNFKNAECINVNLKDWFSSLQEIFDFCTFQLVNRISISKARTCGSFYTIQSVEGSIMLFDHNYSLWIDYKNLILEPKWSDFLVSNDYVIFTANFYQFDFTIGSINHNCTSFDSLSLDNLQGPVIVLLKKNLHIIRIKEIPKFTLNFIPTKELHIAINKTEITDLPNLIEYFNEGFSEKVKVYLSLTKLENFWKDDFEQFISKIFELLNVKRLDISRLDKNLATAKLYCIIANSKSLRSVKLCWNEDLDAQLQVIETNYNVKQWSLEIDYKYQNDEYKEKIQSLLARNDNSIILRGNGVKLVSQMTQFFEIWPISD